jgi:[acyl-carrier-protein] S-malonyltransferase
MTERLRWWSAVLDIDLVHYGTVADADEIRDTAIAQPLLVGAGLATAAAMFGDVLDELPASTAVLAGHSVGEITAAALAGVLTAEAALVLVRERGRAMASAAAIRPTSMTAVLGGDAQAVLAAIAEHGLTPANINGAGQIVAAGTVEQLEAFADAPPEGARLRPLSVAGAFHTEHMAPAVARLRELVAAAPVAEPLTRLLSNADGAVVSSGKDALDRIAGQVAAPVRWDSCMETMRSLGVSAVIELAPAGTLVGLVRRALPGVETLAVKTPDDLDAARKLIAMNHRGLDLAGAPGWRLLVAPIAGTFTPQSAQPGTRLAEGAVLGTVSSRRETQAVVAPCGGTLLEWLAEDGDPVSPGQPLARLNPEVVPA